jgi:hypothetical protein
VGIFWSSGEKDPSSYNFVWHGTKNLHSRKDMTGFSFVECCEAFNLAFEYREEHEGMGIQSVLADPRIIKSPIVVFGRRLMDRGISFRPSTTGNGDQTALGRVATHMLVRYTIVIFFELRVKYFVFAGEF